MNKQRVVVTGIGCISALGKNHAEFWNRLIAGESGITNIKGVNCNELRIKSGGEIADFDSANYFTPNELAWLDRFSQFALIAASEAMEDARLIDTDVSNSRSSVITGSCVGGKSSEDQAFYRFYHEKNRLSARISSLLLWQMRVQARLRQNLESLDLFLHFQQRALHPHMRLAMLSG